MINFFFKFFHNGYLYIGELKPFFNKRDAILPLFYRDALNLDPT